MPKFGKASLARLGTVDPHLQAVFQAVVQRFDCQILEGIRSPERQAELVAQGLSKTLHSKHLTGEAVDVAPYPVDWGEDGTGEQRQMAIRRFYLFAGFVLATAAEMGIRLRWGGDWNGNYDPRDNGTFNDLPHFELVRA